MKLPRGSTGLDASPPAAAFVGHCHHVARTVGGEVVRVERAGVTPNFDTVDIRRRSGTTSVLRHAALPFVAFATPRADDHMELTFIDDDELAGLFEETVLDRATLCADLSTADLSELDPAEHEQITYWRPGTVGEVLFNWWD